MRKNNDPPVRHTSLKLGLSACMMVASIIHTVASHAADAPAPIGDTQGPLANPTKDWLHQPGRIGDPGMTGDWGGERTKLSNEGIDIFSNYQVQTADIVNGGVKRGTSTNNQVILGANFNLSKLMGVPGGVFTFAVSDRYGSNASTLAGVRVTINSNYGEGENFRLANMSFKQNLLHGRLSYQLGYFPAAAEFDYNPLLCSFLNQGFCGHPNSLAADSSGFQNPPGAQLGARVTGFVLPNVYVKVGVFDVNPTRFTDPNQGFRLDTHGSTGTIYLTELGWNASLGANRLPGHYKIGAYYDTSAAPDVVNPKLMHEGRKSGWLSIDQMIFSLGSDSSRGLVLFGNLTQSNRDTSQIQSYDSAGFVFLGPLASRPDDVLSLGWAKSNLNHRKLASEIQKRPEFGYIGAERYIDLSYKIQLTPWLFLTPDFQYLIHPGVFTAARYPNATVIGGELAFKF
jgi:porin